MLARTWYTEIDPDRAEEYERFAREISLPMFRAQQGFAGVLMVRDGTQCRVITLWHGPEDITALETSPTYQHTVARIIGAGFLRGDQRVEVMDAHLFASDLDSEVAR